MQRRTFLITGLSLLAGLAGSAEAKIKTSMHIKPATLRHVVAPSPRVKAPPPTRSLCLFHTHTEELLHIAYRPGKGVSSNEMRRLNQFLRDYRTDEVKPIDPHLFDILNEIQEGLGKREGVFEILSGYRSPETNALLRMESDGVARHSLHLEGRALDIRLRNTPTTAVRNAAVALRQGGVGYYHSSDFVHVDTGEVRYW